MFAKYCHILFVALHISLQTRFSLTNMMTKMMTVVMYTIVKYDGKVSAAMKSPMHVDYRLSIARFSIAKDCYTIYNNPL